MAVAGLQAAPRVALADVLAGVESPEDLFGALVGTRKECLSLIDRTYERYLEGATAEESERLKKLYEGARVALRLGRYGRHDVYDADPSHLRSPRGRYTLGRLLASGDVCDVHLGEGPAKQPVILKVLRAAADQDLLENEVAALKRLNSDKAHEPRLRPYVPELIDSFAARSIDADAKARTRQITVLATLPGFYSLEEVAAAHPGGVHWQDADWILRRLLVALGFAHKNGLVHGAVVPSNILVHPTEHGLVLADWSYAVSGDKEGFLPIAAVSAPYESWYPDEVLKKQRPGPYTDIFLAAKCAIWLMGGDVTTGLLPDRVPAKLRAFLSACVDKTPNRRPDDAWVLKGELDELLGERDFHPLKMPAGSTPLVPYEPDVRTTNSNSVATTATTSPDSQPATTASASPSALTPGPAQTPAPSSSGSSAAQPTTQKGR
jgi:serine/threonine protein kinase